MGIYDRDHRQNDPWKKKNDSFQSNKIMSDEVREFHEASKQRRIYQQFDEQQKVKLKEFKKIWKLDRSDKKLFSFLPWILALVIILAISKEVHKHDTIETQAQKPSEQIEPVSITPIEAIEANEKSLFAPLKPIQIPPTSILSSTYDSESATCPLTLIADNKNYFVKLCDTENDSKTIATFFVRAGEKFKTNIPAGTYNIKYGAGDEWYGEKELFGPFNQYGKSESLVFTDNGYSIEGNIISFYQTLNGNFHTKNIGRDALLEN